jgi:hypothetical protein
MYRVTSHFFHWFSYLPLGPEENEIFRSYVGSNFDVAPSLVTDAELFSDLSYFPNAINRKQSN